MEEKQMKKTLALVLACVMVFGLAACGTKAPTSTTSEVTTAAASQPAASDNVKHYKFGYAFANMDENNMRTLKGLQMYAEELNATGEYDIELIYTDSQANVDKQITDVESLIAQSPDLIMVSAVDVVGSVPALQAVKNAGIITVDDRGCQDDCIDNKFTGFDEDTIGGRLQEAMKAYLEEHPDVNIKAGGIYGQASQSEQLKRVDYLKALAEEMPDRIEILQTQYCDWSTDRATSTVEDWLLRYPEMNAIFTASDDMGLGACNALKASGKKDVLVTAVDGTKIGIQLAQEGEEYFITIGANQEQITRHMMDFWISLADGSYTGGYEYKCPGECFTIVTPDNVDTVDLGAI